ncbi:hypothetical protein MRX96_018176 [Rhipicephalus microplus]
MPSRPRSFCPGPQVSPASSPSPPASVDEAAADPDEVPEHPENDSSTLQMPLDHTRLLEDQARLLRSLLRDPPTDESWAQCEEAWTRAVTLAVEAVRLPPVRPGRQRRQPDPTNPVDMQRLYRRNRRRAVRLILEGTATDVCHTAARPTGPLGAHVVSPPGRLHPASRTRSGSGGRLHVELFDRRAGLSGIFASLLTAETASSRMERKSSQRSAVAGSRSSCRICWVCSASTLVSSIGPERMISPGFTVCGAGSCDSPPASSIESPSGDVGGVGESTLWVILLADGLAGGSSCAVSKLCCGAPCWLVL